ncbi:MAG: peptide chain release factor N(5)-glutamine methyltransferase [Marinilabiliaceae bacterium]
MGATVKEIKRRFREELARLYSTREAGHLFWLVMNHLRGWSKTHLMLHENTKLTHSEHLFAENALERLKNHEPIQYITGETEFFGLLFRVNGSVLIPRPETEELVEWVLQQSGTPAGARVLDIGTGSGCIAIALASRLPATTIEAWDVSPEAIEIARENARTNQVNVDFKLKDVLKLQHRSDDPFHLIVSNPPYVRDVEKELMNSNVLDYEPHVALFVDDEDPLLFFRAIAQFAIKNLVAGGKLFFEINRDFGEATRELLAGYGFEQIEVRKDLSGNSRMVKAVKPVRGGQKSMG